MRVTGSTFYIMKINQIQHLLDTIENSPKNLDDIDIYNICGGNYDDAYALGYRHGQSILADQLRQLIKEQIEIPSPSAIKI